MEANREEIYGHVLKYRPMSLGCLGCHYHLSSVANQSGDTETICQITTAVATFERPTLSVTSVTDRCRQLFGLTLAQS